MDEVIALLSGPAAAGSFEDEVHRHTYDLAQFDSWRHSLTKVRTRPVFQPTDNRALYFTSGWTISVFESSSSFFCEREACCCEKS